MTVDDRFRTWPLGRQVAPYALCPKDREPLISTIEQRGAEFLCEVCGTYYGFLSPVPGAPTKELDARHAELQSAFDAARSARAQVEQS